nr:MAG TPA: hypothetical protein [Caudoviricetes sp.]
MLNEPDSFIIGTDRKLTGQVNLICVGVQDPTKPVPQVINAFQDEDAQYLYDILIGEEKLPQRSQK